MKVVIPTNMRADIHIPKAAGATVMVNGASREGNLKGNYVILEDIGSGTYEFAR